MVNEYTRLGDAVFCALDFETTGVNPALDRIVEIGMVRFTLDETLATFSTLIDPEQEMPERAMEIHGITNEMVHGAPRIGDMLPGVTEFMGDATLVIQNPRFDLTFLEVAFKKCEMDVPPLSAYDTVRLSRKTFVNMPNYRLETLCANLDIESTGHHRALADACSCMEVFRKVVRFHDTLGEWTFRDLTRLHGDAMQPQLSRKQKRRLNLNNDIYIGDVVKIRYMDESGRVTTRRILPKEVVQNGNKTYIHAFCYMRNEDRFFNTRRILKVY
jgi:DNA polymerase-3 subunit epsilon